MVASPLLTKREKTMALRQFTAETYEFKEYPKWVRVPGQEHPVLVQNQIEESALLVEADELEAERVLAEKHMEAGTSIIIDELPTDKEGLVNLARSLGIEVKRFWGVNKLRAEILALKEEEERLADHEEDTASRPHNSADDEDD